MGSHGSTELDYPIIVFGGSPWSHPIWTNRQHVGSRLALRHPVLYVENAVGISIPVKHPRLFGQWLRGPRRVADRTWVVAPRWPVPLSSRVAAARSVDEALAIRQVAAEARRLGFRDPVLWIFQPYYADYIDHVPHSLVVYHCTDEYSTVPGFPERDKQREARLLREADAVFCTAKGLYERKRVFNPHTYYAPNVADITHFAKARDPQLPIAPALRDLPHPILGFIGAVDRYKLDLPLLETLARRHPEWSFVLIGPIGIGDGTQPADLPQLPNMHYLGAAPFADLPGYVRGFDVGLIPYQLNSYTETVFPLKFFEYLAAGKPVVSTDLPALADHRGDAHLAAGADAFEAAIIHALAETGPEFEVARVQAAAGHSWESRVEMLLGVVDERYRETRGG